MTGLAAGAGVIGLIAAGPVIGVAAAVGGGLFGRFVGNKAVETAKKRAENLEFEDAGGPAEPKE